MTESTRRLWGIDVIATIYGVVTLSLVWLSFNSTDVGRTFGMVFAPLGAVLCLGIAFRVNIVRIGLMSLLVVALVGDGLLILFFVGALAEMFQCPPNKDPLNELMRMPIRLAATLTMFLYLKRPDVRDAFRRTTRQGATAENIIGNTDPDT